MLAIDICCRLSSQLLWLSRSAITLHNRSAIPPCWKRIFIERLAAPGDPPASRQSATGCAHGRGQPARGTATGRRASASGAPPSAAPPTPPATPAAATWGRPAAPMAPVPSSVHSVGNPQHSTTFSNPRSCSLVMPCSRAGAGSESALGGNGASQWYVLPHLAPELAVVMVVSHQRRYVEAAAAAGAVGGLCAKQVRPLPAPDLLEAHARVGQGACRWWPMRPPRCGLPCSAPDARAAARERRPQQHHDRRNCRSATRPTV